MSQVPARQEQLQFLRFLAFLNIFITHAEQWLFFPYRSSHCANAAVSFFFMLSGMVAGYSFVRKQTVSVTLREEVRFIWKRLRKIYPLYVMTTLLAVLFSNIPASVISGNMEALKPSVFQLFKNLFLIQSWFPEGAHTFNSVGWFLSTLLLLYVCSLPIAAGLKWLTRQKTWFLLLGAVFLGTAVLVVAYCKLSPDNYVFWHYQFPPARLGEYALGMMIGFGTTLLRDKLPAGRWRRWLFTAAEVFVMAFWYYSLSRPGNYWRNHIVSWLIPNTLLLTVFSFGWGWVSQLFRCRPLIYLGDISFECYLVHQLLLVRLAVNAEGLPASFAGNAFCFLFTLALSILIAAVLHKDEKKMERK